MESSAEGEGEGEGEVGECPPQLLTRYGQNAEYVTVCSSLYYIWNIFIPQFSERDSSSCCLRSYKLTDADNDFRQENIIFISTSVHL